MGLKLTYLIDEQLHERYKHFAIYGPALQGKTKLAKHIAGKYNGIYLDLLQEFKNNEELKSGIDVFGPSKLITFITQRQGDSRLMIIDQMDFLINTWDDPQLREFLVFIDRNQSEVCYLFILQSNRILEREALIKSNDKGHSRLINILNIQQGGAIDGED